MTAMEAIEEFLGAYIGMSLKPSPSNCFIISGKFPVYAQFGDDSCTLVDKEFHLKIIIPCDYPNALPIVYELEQNALIPTSPEYHKNGDLSLCLGSPLALFTQLSQNPSLISFAKACIVPHLASAILKKEKGMPFKQGELKHYDEGLEEDLANRFGVKLPLKYVPLILSRLGEKKGKANKKPCPCGSGRNLGSCSCSIHRFISSERRKAGSSRRFYRNVARYYDFYVNRQKENPEVKNKSLATNSDCVISLETNSIEEQKRTS